MASDSLSYLQLDVFTEVPLEGNGLAVVLGADGVGDRTMGAFARETRQAETTFVQAPRAEGADYRNRIWTIAGEIPFAGHPSLGTAVAVARSRGESKSRYVQETGAGLQPVEVARDGDGGEAAGGGEVAVGDDRWRASMLQEPAAFGPLLEPAELMAAAGLRAADAHPELPPQLVSTGLPTVIAPVRDEAAIGRAEPDLDAIDALVRPHGADNLYLAWCEAESGRAHARMFSRLVMGGEDPATGSAAGPLGAYLAERAGVPRVEIAQGAEMGRPSRLLAEMEDERVRVGGDAVVVVEGTVRLPREG